MSVKTYLAGLLLALVAGTALAATPTIVSTNTTSAQNTTATTQVVTLPGSLSVGNLLICAIAIDGDDANNGWPGDWNEILDQGNPATGAVTMSVAWHRINGGEGSTINVTSNNERSSHYCIQISGDDTGQAPEIIATGTVAAGTTTNPPSLTPTGGSKTYLWIALSAWDDASLSSCSGFPTNYINTGVNVGNAASDNATVCWGTRATTAASEDPGVFTSGSSVRAVAATIAVHPSTGVAVNFTSGPNVAAAANGYTISGTVNGSGYGTLTVYAVGVAPGDGTPTCAQIIAGHNDGDSAAILAASEAWTTDVGDSFALTTASKPPSLDVHVCANDTTNSTSVTSAADQLRSARSGFALVTMASVSATGICDYDSYFTPDCAIGDVFEYETTTNENAGCAVSIDTAGDVTLTPDTGSECDGRPTFEISYEDVSSATNGLFTAPTVGNFATDDTAYINNTAPVCAPETQFTSALLAYNTAMSSIDLNEVCTDADGDALTFSVSSGALPSGTSLGGTGNGTWSGTPDTEDEVGTAATIQACDPAGDCDTYDMTSYVVDTWTVTDCAGLSVSACETAVVADAPWRASTPNVVIAGYSCDAGAEDLVLSQDPAASAEAAATDGINVTLSILCPSSSYTGSRKVVYELSDVSGLTMWVDYIPVVVQIGCNAGTYDEDGCWAVTPLASTTGKTAWVDYIPVYAVSESANKWRYENNGWIPVDTLTP